MSRISPVDSPNKRLKALLAAEERLEKAALRLAEEGEWSWLKRSSRDTELLRAAKALRKLRDR